MAANQLEIGCGKDFVHRRHESEEIAGRHAASSIIKFCGGTVPPTEYGVDETKFFVSVGLGEVAAEVTVFRCPDFQWRPLVEGEAETAMQAAIGAALQGHNLVAASQVSSFAAFARQAETP